MRLEALQAIRLIIVVFNILQRPRRQNLERPSTCVIFIWHIEHIGTDIVACRVDRYIYEWVEAIFDEMRLLSGVRGVEVHQSEWERIHIAFLRYEAPPHFRHCAINADDYVAFIAGAVFEVHSDPTIILHFIVREALAIIDI